MAQGSASQHPQTRFQKFDRINFFSPTVILCEHNFFSMSCVNDAITLIMKIIFSFIELFFNNGESKKDF